MRTFTWVMKKWNLWLIQSKCFWSFEIHAMRCMFSLHLKWPRRILSKYNHNVLQKCLLTLLFRSFITSSCCNPHGVPLSPSNGTGSEKLLPGVWCVLKTTKGRCRRRRRRRRRRRAFPFRTFPRLRKVGEGGGGEEVCMTDESETGSPNKPNTLPTLPEAPSPPHASTSTHHWSVVSGGVCRLFLVETKK